MYWGIIWDIVGSIYEWDNIKTKNFPLFGNWVFFTDDTVLLVATMYAIINDINFADAYTYFYQKYPWKEYWWNFSEWCNKNIKEDKINPPYNSYWNGSAMRVAPIWYITNSPFKITNLSTKSAECTHNNPRWIMWANAVAAIIYMIKRWANKKTIKTKVERIFWYNLSRKLGDIRKVYEYNETCQETVPEAIIAFLESTDFEDAIRNAISIWWDSDTLASITWSIAEAYYWVPEELIKKARSYLDSFLLWVIDEFYEKYV